ncbi:hypothetical protein GJ496_002353 [Pomphorhynchus laevis]|nr:hypothetical protein GJ496_002353 [Pomphorhynchus laevis]
MFCPCIRKQSNNNRRKIKHISFKNEINRGNGSEYSEYCGISSSSIVRKQSREINVLLLGASESGKSTFIKQIRIIHDQKFNDAELHEFKCIIRKTLLVGIKHVLKFHVHVLPSCEYEEDEKQRVNGIKKMFFDIIDVYSDLNWMDFQHRFFADHAALVHQVARIIISYNQYIHITDSSIRCKQFQARTDNAKLTKRDIDFDINNSQNSFNADAFYYFLTREENISAQDYVPSTSDILYCRKTTTSITEHKVLINKQIFVFIDVGGQRLYRAKWCQCLTHARTILFMTSTSEFDEVLTEDGRTNRLIESLDLFAAISRNIWLKNISQILFLNKTDLLVKKVETAKFSEYFSEFKGNDQSLNDVKSFILSLFMNIKCMSSNSRQDSNQLYYHFTNMLDGKQIKLVFNDVKDMILKDNVSRLMLE